MTPYRGGPPSTRAKLAFGNEIVRLFAQLLGAIMFVGARGRRDLGGARDIEALGARKAALDAFLTEHGLPER